jgi:hypothetical protein
MQIHMQNAYDFFFRFIALAIPTGFAYFSRFPEIPSPAAAAAAAAAAAVAAGGANPVRQAEATCVSP